MVELNIPKFKLNTLIDWPGAWGSSGAAANVSSADAADTIRYASDGYYDINKLSSAFRTYADIGPVKYDYIDPTGGTLGYDAAVFEARAMTEDPDADFDIDTDALEEWAQEVCGE